MPVDVTANYVRIRVASPSKFIRMRVKTLGKGIRAIVGFKKGGGSEIQSFLFPRSRYTLAQAKAWIKAHDYSVHESWLVTDILVGENYLEFQESLITPEVEAKINESEFNIVEDIKKKETWEWLLS